MFPAPSFVDYRYDTGLGLSGSGRGGGRDGRGDGRGDEARVGGGISRNTGSTAAGTTNSAGTSTGAIAGGSTTRRSAQFQPTNPGSLDLPPSTFPPAISNPSSSSSTNPNPNPNSGFPGSLSLSLPLPLILSGGLGGTRSGSGSGSGGVTNSRSVGLDESGRRGVNRMTGVGGRASGGGGGGSRGATIGTTTTPGSGPGVRSSQRNQSTLASPAQLPNRLMNSPTTTTTTTSQSNSTSRSSSSAKTATTTNNNKNYQCTFEGCTKGFMTIPHMKRHLKSHSGLQPYDCPFCSKKFGRSDVRNKHVQSTHEDRAGEMGVGAGGAVVAGMDGLADYAGSGVGWGNQGKKKGEKAGREGVGLGDAGGVKSGSGSGRNRRPSDTSLGLTSPLLPSDSHQFGGETESRAGQKEKKGKGRGRRSSSISVQGSRRRSNRPLVLPSPIPIPIPVPLREGDPASAISTSTIHDSFSPISAFSPTPPTPRTGLPSLSSFSPATAPLHLGALGNSWIAPSDTRMYASGGFGLGLNREVDELDEEDEDEMAFGEMEEKNRSIASGFGTGGYQSFGHHYSSSMSTPGMGITTPGTASSSTFTHDLPSANSTPSYEFSRSHPAPSYFSSSLFPLTNSATSSSYTSYRSSNTPAPANHLPPLPSIKWGSEAYHPPAAQQLTQQQSGVLSGSYTGLHRYHKSQDSFAFTTPATSSSDTPAVSTSNLPTMFSQSLPVSNQSMYSTTSRPGMYSLGSDPTLPTLQTLHQNQPPPASTMNDPSPTPTTSHLGLNVFIPRATPQYGPMSAPIQSDPYRFSSSSDLHSGDHGMARFGGASIEGGYDGVKSNGFGTRNHDDFLKNMGFKNPFENRS